jgi:ribosome maturation factor RimP
MVKEDIARLMRESADELGFMIYESSIYIRGDGSRITARIDSVGGISHNDCESYSRRLSEKLDASGLLPNYSLEISSPGLKRKIRTLEEFVRFAGSPAMIVYDEDGERKTAKGKIIKVENDIITVLSDRKEVHISFSGIDHANLDY